jgi:hypothetical protein
MLRKTIIVLATAAALTGGLTADAVALATAHTGWDGLGAVGHAIATTPSNVIKLHRARPANGTTSGRDSNTLDDLDMQRFESRRPG